MTSKREWTAGPWIVQALAEAAKPLVAEIALYEPSAGEDGDELVSVRLGDLKALRAALERARTDGRES